MQRTTPAWIAAGLVFLVHALANAHYGYFRDELYFIICGQHPQFGYVDQPPVVPLLAAATQVFGHSLWLLRIVPAVFAAGGAYVTCLLAMEFGGGLFAQALATIVFLFSPVLLSFGQKVSTDEVGLLAWPLIALLVVRIARGSSARLWIAAGMIAGIAFESKYSVVFFLAALVGGLLLTRQRVVLRSRWFLYGCAVTALIALPNVVWQAAYHFPMWELLRNGQDGKNLIASPPLYLLQEILIVGLFFFPIWLGGLIFLLRDQRLRFLGYAYVLLIAQMLALHGKHYYPANIYPILIAAGGAAYERWTARAQLFRPALLAYALLLGPVFLPLALPVLSERGFIAYQARLADTLHFSKQSIATEHGREHGQLTGDYADMHGWPQLAALVARIYDGLPPAQRAQAVVFASNYGEASAIAFFTPQIPVVSGHNQYWLWGTRGYSGSVVIDINGDCGARLHLYRSSVRAATFDAPYAIGYESGIPIMLCRGARMPLAAVWPVTKTYE
jgi:hypothetical protein